MTYSVYVQGSFLGAKIYNEEDTMRIVLNNRYSINMKTPFEFSRKKIPYHNFLIGRFSSIEEAKWFISKEVVREFKNKNMEDSSLKGIRDKAWRYYEKHKDEHSEYLI
jgi:hypothetical protein